MLLETLFLFQIELQILLVRINGPEQTARHSKLLETLISEFGRNTTELSDSLTYGTRNPLSPKILSNISSQTSPLLETYATHLSEAALQNSLWEQLAHPRDQFQTKTLRHSYAEHHLDVEFA